MNNQQDPSSSEPPKTPPTALPSQHPRAGRSSPAHDFGNPRNNPESGWPVWLQVIFFIFLIVIVLPLLLLFALFLYCILKEQGRW